MLSYPQLHPSWLSHLWSSNQKHSPTRQVRFFVNWINSALLFPLQWQLQPYTVILHCRPLTTLYHCVTVYDFNWIHKVKLLRSISERSKRDGYTGWQHHSKQQCTVQYCITDQSLVTDQIWPNPHIIITQQQRHTAIIHKHTSCHMSTLMIFLIDRRQSHLHTAHTQPMRKMSCQFCIFNYHLLYTVQL